MFADQTPLTVLQPQFEWFLEAKTIDLFLIGASRAYLRTIKELSVLKLACAATCPRSTKSHPSREAVQRILAYHALPTMVASSYKNPNSHLPRPWDLKHRSDYHGYVMLLFVVVWPVCLATLPVPAPPQCALHGKNPQLAS